MNAATNAVANLAMPMAPDSPSMLVARFDRLKAARGTFETHWQEVADYALPTMADFNTTRAPGEKRHQKIYDDTAPRALSRFAAAAQSFIAPPNSRYQRIAPRHRELLRIEGVGAFYDDLTDAIYGARSAPRAQFHHGLLASLMQVGAFGNGPGYVAADPKGGVIYSALPLAQVLVELDAHGRPDSWWRKFPLSARQAAALFGAAALPSAIAKALEKTPEQIFQFLHCVYPNRAVDPQFADWRGMAYVSVYIACDGLAELERSGHRSMPYFMARYETAAAEAYARGPCMAVLPSIKMVNGMAKAGLNAAELAALPPLLMSDDAFDVFKLAPAALNPGTLDLQGRPLVQGLQLGSQPQHMLAQMQAAQKAIEDALLVSLFQILVQTPRMSATEALLRSQERGMLIGPMLSRLQGDIFDAITPREIDILDRQGALPEPPAQLLDMAAQMNRAGRIRDARELLAYENVYVGPTQQMIAASDMVNLQQYIEQVVKLGSIFPDAPQSLDPVEIQRLLAQGMFVPARVVKSDRRLAEEEAARRRDQEAAMALGGAEQGAGVIRDLAAARKDVATAALAEVGGAPSGAI